jgi:hypothetical protein
MLSLPPPPPYFATVAADQKKRRHRGDVRIDEVVAIAAEDRVDAKIAAYGVISAPAFDPIVAIAALQFVRGEILLPAR